MAFAIAVICTGNRFRSPLTAAYLRARTAGLSVTVESFGTLDLPRAPALPEAVMAASRAGIDLTSHRTRSIQLNSLKDVALVIGFEQAHVTAAVVKGNASRGRCFTLPELVDLLADSGHLNVHRTAEDSLIGAKAAVARAHEFRSALATSHSPVEIPDPLGRSSPAQQATAKYLQSQSNRLAQALFPNETRVQS